MESEPSAAPEEGQGESRVSGPQEWEALNGAIVFSPKKSQRAPDSGWQLLTGWCFCPSRPTSQGGPGGASVRLSSWTPSQPRASASPPERRRYLGAALRMLQSHSPAPPWDSPSAGAPGGAGGTGQPGSGEVAAASQGGAGRGQACSPEATERRFLNI